jgi:hypothetical protein
MQFFNILIKNSRIKFSKPIFKYNSLRKSIYIFYYIFKLYLFILDLFIEFIKTFLIMILYIYLIFKNIIIGFKKLFLIHLDAIDDYMIYLKEFQKLNYIKLPKLNLISNYTFFKVIDFKLLPTFHLISNDTFFIEFKLLPTLVINFIQFKLLPTFILISNYTFFKVIEFKLFLLKFFKKLFNLISNYTFFKVIDFKLLPKFINLNRLNNIINFITKITHNIINFITKITYNIINFITKITHNITKITHNIINFITKITPIKKNDHIIININLEKSQFMLKFDYGYRVNNIINFITKIINDNIIIKSNDYILININLEKSQFTQFNNFTKKYNFNKKLQYKFNKKICNFIYIFIDNLNNSIIKDLINFYDFIEIISIRYLSNIKSIFIFKSNFNIFNISSDFSQNNSLFKSYFNVYRFKFLMFFNKYLRKIFYLIHEKFKTFIIIFYIRFLFIILYLFKLIC